MLKGTASVAMATYSIRHIGGGRGNDQSALIPGAWKMGYGHSYANTEVCMSIFGNHAIYIPYSAKFSRHLYFVDWPLKAISLHNVRGMTAYWKPRL